MSRNSSQAPVRLTLVNLQIVVAALLGGSGVFLVVAIFLVASGAVPQAGGDLAFLVPVAIAVAAVAALAQFLAGPLSQAQARRQSLQQASPPEPGPQSGPEGERDTGSQAGRDEARQRLWAQFSTMTLMRGAIFEGAGFFCIVAYLVTQSPVPLALAVALMLAIAATIPTRSRADRWLDDQMERARQERQFVR